MIISIAILLAVAVIVFLSNALPAYIIHQCNDDPLTGELPSWVVYTCAFLTLSAAVFMIILAVNYSNLQSAQQDIHVYKQILDTVYTKIK